MTADASVKMNVGEKRPIFDQVTIASGTLTIAASPAPTFTLYNSAGAVVPGLSAVAVTGYDPTALAAPRVWYDLDTVGPPPTTPLTAGWYNGVFTFTAADSDGVTRNYVREVSIQIGAVP